MGHTDNWIGYYSVERECKTLIVHTYEVAGEQWKHYYQIFLKEDGGNNLRKLHSSTESFYKREIALEEGRKFAEGYKFEVKEERKERPSRWRRLLSLLRKAGITL